VGRGVLFKIIIIIEYSLRESVSAQGREGRGFDSDPAIFYLVIPKSG
jgi:hypothetical protein